MVRQYSDIVALFEEKGCELYTTEDEFILMKTPDKSVFSFKASCGHDNTVTLTNFVCKCSGVTCKTCMNIRVRDKLIEFHKDNDQPADKNHVLETEVYNKLNNILNNDLDIMKTREGCTADFIIRPKNNGEDMWLGVQLKTTRGICHDLYTFSLRGKKYENMVILCCCTHDDSMWLIPFDAVSHIKNNLNIGLTNKSVYSKYKVNQPSLLTSLIHYFGTFKLDSQKHYMIPKHIYSQNEIKYSEKREYHCDFLTFVAPEIEQSYYDFKINGRNIQEKVATKRIGRKDAYITYIRRSKGNNVKHQYKLGMNEYYWIHIPDSDLFYILPESELYDNGYINGGSSSKNDISNKMSINISTNYKRAWYHKYQYNYKKLDREFISDLFE